MKEKDYSVKYYKKNVSDVCILEYQFTEQVIRIFLDGKYKKTIFYRDIRYFRVANFDDVIIYLLFTINKKYRLPLVLDKKEDRGLMDFLSDKL